MSCFHHRLGWWAARCCSRAGATEKGAAAEEDCKEHCKEDCKENPCWCEFQWQQHANVYWIGFLCGNCVRICVPMILWNCKRPRCLGSKAWKNISKDKPWQAVTDKPWQAHRCLRSNWRPLSIFVILCGHLFWWLLMQAATSLDSERDEKQRTADERVLDPQFGV